MFDFNQWATLFFITLYAIDDKTLATTEPTKPDLKCKDIILTPPHSSWMTFEKTEIF